MTAFDCMYVCAPYKCLVTSKVRKKVLDPLGLELLHPFSGQRPQGQLAKKKKSTEPLILLSILNQGGESMNNIPHTKKATWWSWGGRGQESLWYSWEERAWDRSIGDVCLQERGCYTNALPLSSIPCPHPRSWPRSPPPSRSRDIARFPQQGDVMHHKSHRCSWPSERRFSNTDPASCSQSPG